MGFIYRLTSPPGKSYIGRTHTGQAKQKMSDSKKGENHHFYGKTMSDDHKQKLDLQIQVRIILSPKKCTNMTLTAHLYNRLHLVEKRHGV